MKKFFVFFIISAVFFASPAWAGHSEGLGGAPFTDPSDITEMPPGWEEQPVRHDPSEDRVDIAVTLDQHLYPVLLPIIREYAAARKLSVSVEEGTCGVSSGKLVRKAVDIGGFCCPPGMTDRLPGLVFHTLGVAPIALLVHPANRVSDISIEEARRIFKGEVYRWSEITDLQGQQGPDLLVMTVGRLHCKLRPGHWRLLLDNEDLFSPRLQEVGAIPDMISLVSANPGAIGYEVLHMVRRYQETGDVKALKIDGLDPAEPGHLISGDYPLYRTFNITTWEGGGVANAEARKLAEHLLKEIGTIEERAGIIPAERLRRAGWKFKGNELVGEPK